MRLGGGLRLEDDTGGRPEVVLDALAGEAVAPVEQHDPAGGDGLAGLRVDLHPVGFEADVPLLDLDVALGDQEFLSLEVLDAVGVYGDGGPGFQGEPLALLSLTLTGEEGEPQDHDEPDQTECGHGPPPRRSGPPPRSQDESTVEVTRS
jgi:hypothetical protein